MAQRAAEEEEEGKGGEENAGGHGAAEVGWPGPAPGPQAQSAE